MKTRVSIVAYLNTAPLVWGLTHGPLRGKYDLSFTVPSRCAEDLRSGAADVAIIPAIEFQRIPDLVVLPELAVASKHRVRSLLLISSKPIAQVRTIALDQSSRSTQALVKILCAQHWHIAPQFSEAAPVLSEMLRSADAALLIGDPALRLSIAMENTYTGRPALTSQPAIVDACALGLDSPGKFHVFDVVSEWRALTGLPAVLAIWAAQSSALTPELAADFAASRDYGLSRISEIAAAASVELQLPATALEGYLRENIDYSLDVQNLQGLTRYYEAAAQLGLIPAPRNIDWAPAAIPDLARARS